MSYKGRREKSHVNGKECIMDKVYLRICTKGHSETVM